MDYGRFGIGKNKNQVLDVLEGGFPNEISTVCRSTFVRHDPNHQTSLLTHFFSFFGLFQLFFNV